MSKKEEYKVKKFLAVLLTVLMSISLVACGGDTTGDDSTQGGDETQTVKMGLGVSSTVSGNGVDADHESGKFEQDATYALVVFDAEGKITNVKLNVAQNSVTWDGAGVATAGTQPSKFERDDDYGMRGASPIEAEWDEQTRAFEEYVIGKTVDEVKGMELDTENHSGPVDLTSSCTISVVEFINAIVNAAENPVEVTGATNFGLASIVNPESTANASADSDGTAQYDTTIAAVATDADGKIVGAKVDVAQQSVKFDTTGALAGALEDVDLRSKVTKKEDYNMKSTSESLGNIEGGGEWYEQALAYEAYLVGKTADEVTGMELDAENHNGPVDLATSCTMSVVDLNAAVVKAVGNATAEDAQ